MPELFNGSQYSSGWKNISRNDEIKKANTELDKKLTLMSKEFEKVQLELDEKIKKTDEYSKLIQNDLNNKIKELNVVAASKEDEIKRITEELNTIITCKDNEIKKLTEENIKLSVKNEALKEQLSYFASRRKSGFMDLFAKNNT